MVLFNYATRELTAKIVYYGPGLCGKTTNLQYIYDSLPDSVRKGKMLSLATKTDRTLFFDFLPIDLGMIRGMKTRIQLYTVPGQVFYNSTRKLVLKGADGVVFVADSQTKMLEADVGSYKNLEDNLREMGVRLDEIPLVMQFNKRDLPNITPVEEMNTQLNRHNAPFYEAVAMTGIGVEDTLKAITKLVLSNLAAKYKAEGAGAPASTPAGPEAASTGPASVRPAPRDAVATAATATAPTGPAGVFHADPEDPELEVLEIEEEEPASPPTSRLAPRPAPIAARSPARGAATGEDEEIIDLVEEMALPGGDEPREGSDDLGEDLLEEIEEEALTAVAHPSGPRPAPSGPPVHEPARGLRVVPQPRALALDTAVDPDEPIDLEEDWDTLSPAPAPSPALAAPVDVGSLTPGEDRMVEVPLSARVDGRALRINLRITLRLSS